MSIQSSEWELFYTDEMANTHQVTPYSIIFDASGIFYWHEGYLTFVPHHRVISARRKMEINEANEQVN